MDIGQAIQYALNKIENNQRKQNQRSVIEQYLKGQDVLFCSLLEVAKVFGMAQFLSSPLAGKRDIIVTFLFGVCVCVRVSVRICPDHNLYNNAWISKQFGTVVALEEEKCHLKHF